MPKWSAYIWAKVALLAYAEAFVGLLAAAVLLQGVTLTAPGAFAAPLGVAAFGVAAVVLIRRAAGQRHRLWPVPFAIFFASPLLFLGGLIVADQLVSGFNVEGFWSYAITAAVLWIASVFLDFLARQVAFV